MIVFAVSLSPQEILSCLRHEGVLYFLGSPGERFISRRRPSSISHVRLRHFVFSFFLFCCWARPESMDRAIKDLFLGLSRLYY
jgi:hypothetical protein